MEWFTVDRQGLLAQLERRGKSFALFELIQNAWDSGTDRVSVTLDPVEGQPYAKLTVEDFGGGFANLDDAFTMFGRSTSAADPSKRGRFSVGEKTVLALCRHAQITSTSGTVTFSAEGRRRSAVSRDRGSLFTGDIRMTRDELAAVVSDMRRLIPPVATTFNGERIEAPRPLATFRAKLPTEFADSVGVLRRSVRECIVEVYPADQGEAGEVLELGIPVVEADLGGFRVNVLQKVPLNIERDNVTAGFLKALRVAVVNSVHEHISEEEAAQPWAQEAAADSRITAEAFGGIMAKRFGEHAVVAVPGAPLSNAQAAADGFTVIHGGALSAGAWANARKLRTFTTSSEAFPTMTPEALARAAAEEERRPKCPSCGK